MRATWLVGLCAVAVVVAGCLGNFGFSGPGGDFPNPEVVGTYKTGSATLVLTQDETTQTVNLTRVSPGSEMVNIIGANVTWRSDDGWGLQVTTTDTSALFGSHSSPSAGATPAPTSAPQLSELAVFLISNHDYWRASSNDVSGNRCIVDLTEASATHVAGTATCRGLKWTDGTNSEMLSVLNPVYIDGQDPFDVDVTFDAMP